MARLGQRFFNSAQTLMEGNPDGHTGTAQWEAMQPGPVTAMPLDFSHRNTIAAATEPSPQAC